MERESGSLYYFRIKYNLRVGARLLKREEREDAVKVLKSF